VTDGRIPCGGLLQRDGLIAVELLGVAWRGREACGVLARFAGAGIPLLFLQVGAAADGRKALTLGMAAAEHGRCVEVLASIRNDRTPPEIAVVEPAAVLTLYGPHFGERTGLSLGVAEALGGADVDVIALGSSVNSISLLLHAADVVRAREALRGRFRWPE